jgi:hypothetical protein
MTLVEENKIVIKTHLAICCVVNFLSAGVVTHDRRIGPWRVDFMNPFWQKFIVKTKFGRI